MAKLLITYRKSTIGYNQGQKDTVRSLGLRKLHQSVVRADTPSLRGMLFKVRHLVTVAEVGDDYELPVKVAPARPTVIKKAEATASAPAPREAAPAAAAPAVEAAPVTQEAEATTPEVEAAPATQVSEAEPDVAEEAAPRVSEVEAVPANQVAEAAEPELDADDAEAAPRVSEVEAVLANQVAEAAQPDTDDAEAAPVATRAVQPVAAAESAGDDLELIEGIGPKIAGVLRAAGITTFAQLAASSEESVEDILRAANLRLADAATWGRQAQLAADGKLDELRALQDRLKGGRDVG